MTAVRFFCENCGAQARPHDRICRKCGSFFNQVRCPKCQHQGEVELFMHGCPSCGYSGDIGGQPNKGSLMEVDYPFEDEVDRPKPRPLAERLPLLIALGLFIITFLILAGLFIAKR